MSRPIPVFLKIAADLTGEELAEIAEVALRLGRGGHHTRRNTTLSREGLASRHRGEAGGLWASRCSRVSTRVLARLYRLTEGRLPLIGVGGVANAEQGLGKAARGPRRRCSFYTALGSMAG